MGKFDNYLFRCSALGRIVTASGSLTEDAKTYLQEVFIGEIYGVKREAYGKAIEKGKKCESAGITMLQHIYPHVLLKKNTERKQNDFIKGECDVDVDGEIVEIKNAEERFSFGKANLSHIYKMQVKGYCYLWQKSRGRLFYCLNNMPEDMLLDEERKLFYARFGEFLTMESPEYLAACQELRAAHNYDAMPLEARFKLWEVEFTDADREAIEAGVIKARNYLNKLFDEEQLRLLTNRKLLGKIDIST